MAKHKLVGGGSDGCIVEADPDETWISVRGERYERRYISGALHIHTVYAYHDMDLDQIIERLLK